MRVVPSTRLQSHVLSLPTKLAVADSANPAHNPQSDFNVLAFSQSNLSDKQPTITSPTRPPNTLSTVAIMGRVRTKTVKKSAKVIIERYYPKLSLDFEVNKRICDEIAIIASKRLRNKVRMSFVILPSIHCLAFTVPEQAAARQASGEI